MPRLIDTYAARVFQYFADAALVSSHASGSLDDLIYKLLIGNSGGSVASNTYLGRAVVDILASASAPKAPVVLSTMSPECLGIHIAATITDGANGWQSAAPGANTCQYYPFQISESLTVAKLFWLNGATAAGTIDIGIMDENGVRKVSGSAAQSGTSVVQSVDPADTVLTAGRYYFALATNNIGSAFVGIQPNQALGLANIVGTMMGVYYEASGTVPANATFATHVGNPIYMCGLTTKTVI